MKTTKTDVHESAKSQAGPCYPEFLSIMDDSTADGSCRRMSARDRSVAERLATHDNPSRGKR